MWITWFEAAAAFYLVGGSLVINATGGLRAKIIFKVIPMCIGLPLAFAVAAKMLGWPISP